MHRHILYNCFMSQVSKRKINDEDFKKILDKFVEVINISGSRRNSKDFIKEFFYPTERVMFAKRIGIIYMIMQKIPDRVVADTLAVSTSTVGRIIDKYEKGDYKFLESQINKNKENLIDLIEKLYFILPPKVGRKRYRFVRQGKFHI